MRKFDIRNINRIDSYEWSRCNNESRAPMWREAVAKYYGGSFSRKMVNKGVHWVWSPPEDGEVNRWIFIDPEGKEHMVSNFKGFCKENNLDDGRMYDTYNGKRKHHKKWTAKKLHGTGYTDSNIKNFGRNDGPPPRS